MPEGDTIHLVARRLNAGLAGRRLERAEAPSARSPLHGRTAPLAGRTVEGAEARGKHLLVWLSDGLVLHSHLGMNGRWWVGDPGAPDRGKPWLLLGSGPTVATQSGGRLLRLASRSRIRADPQLARLGPDPLGAGFDAASATAGLRGLGGEREIGEALLDQRIVAGVGNAIRNEACFAARLSPWRRVVELSEIELGRVITEVERVMRASLADGRRPRAIYRADRRGCPACGGPVSVRGQGDANRTTYWCPRCQA